MRIPNTTSSESLVSRLQTLTARQARLQDQVSSGQRISEASDDPAAMGRVLGLETEKAQIHQWARNGDRATEISEASFSAVKGLKQLSDRAGELSVLGAGATGPDAYRAYTAEVEQMLEQALQTANTQHSGEYLFGGTRTDAAPFTATRDAAGRITSVAYAGAADSAQFRTSEGAPVAPFTSGATNAEFATFLNRLVALRDGLAAQDAGAVQTVRADLQSSEDDLLVTISDIGATQTRLEASASQNEARFAELEKLVGRETDVDLAQSVVRLTQAQTAYEAALKSGAQMMQTSLLDYLR